MSIQYQRKSAPLASLCCFIPRETQNVRILLPHPPIKAQTVYTSPLLINRSKNRQTDKIKNNANPMKKSISSMNLKRKSNQFSNQPNQNSIQQNQNIPNFQKKNLAASSKNEELLGTKISQAEEPSVLKNKLCLVESDNNKIKQIPLEQNCEDSNQNSKAMQSLTERGLKIYKYNIQSKKVRFSLQGTSENHYKQNQTINQCMIKNQDIEQLNQEQSQKPIDLQEKEIPSTFNKIDTTRSDQTLDQTTYKNLQKLQGSQKIQKRHHLQLNQINSMIIQSRGREKYAKIQFSPSRVKGFEEFLKKKRTATQSKFIMENSSTFANKALRKDKPNFSWKSQKELFQNDNTVLSDYEEDECKSMRERMQQSAIIMNFFHPSDVVKANQCLTKSENLQSQM